MKRAFAIGLGVCLSLGSLACSSEELEPEVDRVLSDWSEVTTMPGEIGSYHRAVAVDGRLFVLGGRGLNVVEAPGTAPMAGLPIRDVHAYDPASDEWEEHEPLPRPLDQPNIAAVGQRIYLLGGKGSKQLFVYDVNDREWTEIGERPVEHGIGASAVAVLGEKIYLAGGVIPDPENPRGARVRDFSVYDTETDEWEELPPMVEESGYFGAAISLGYLFTFGGSTVAEVPRPGRTFAYDLEVEEWVEGAVVPVPVSSFAVAHHRGRIYLFGGIAGATGRINHETQVYDVRTDEWSTTTSMPTPRFAMTAGVIDGQIYVPGGVQQTGENDFEAVPLVEVLGP